MFSPKFLSYARGSAKPDKATFLLVIPSCAKQTRLTNLLRDISKFAMHYIIEEIDEDTSMEDLQKMMIVALIYRLLVCFYEIICIWGAGGATPGKFLLGLRVVTCDTSVLIAPSRVLVIPSSNVSMTTSTIRALIKNFSIASFFPAFITLLFFQHNRTAYDIVAGTIVVRRNGVR
uniref:Family with sequence similarity 8 member A1 n=1 Tax=Sphenodon punctatus TaxID=8508 RepID=A0A8D0HN74_SPHPU